jgi:hypothetical protein
MASPATLKSLAKPVFRFLKGGIKPIVGSATGTVKHTGKAVKSPLIDKVVGFAGGNNKRIMGRIESEAIRSAKFKALKKSIGKKVKLGTMPKTRAKEIINAKRKNYLGEGNYATRVIRNSINDISHPIDNARGNIVKMLRDYDPVTKTWSNKSAKRLVGSAALNIGLPASFIAPVWKDKDLSTGKKIGKSIGYAATPLAFNKTIPSMMAYSGVDKAFSAPKPIKPPKALTS